MDGDAAAGAQGSPPDRELAVRARGGDEAAFAELVHRHQGRVYRIAFRMVRDPDQAEELTQITFVRAFRSLHRYREEFDFHPWLYRIAVNASLTHIEKRKRLRAQDIDVTPPHLIRTPPHQESPLEVTQRRELAARLESALSRIPEEQRTVFLLRVSEGLSYAEIAEVLEIPTGTVMSRLSRAREALRKLVV